jgi:flagellar basal body rod protein FlgG
MIAQQLNVEVISNNIANMNTTGYKRQRAEAPPRLTAAPSFPRACRSASA